MSEANIALRYTNQIGDLYEINIWVWLGDLSRKYRRVVDLATVPPDEWDQIASGGFDALVFTAGIGEHAAPIRERVCRAAAWLGVELDPTANAAGGPCISTAASRIPAWVIPTNEDLMIARHTRMLVAAGAFQWSGVIPPRKWMNFYTKVITKLASSPGLTVRVSLEAPAEGESASAKIEDIKSALRELGLDENWSG